MRLAWGNAWLAIVIASGMKTRHVFAAEQLAEAVRVRYVSLETGGMARPRFVTTRLLRFAATLEAKLDHAERIEQRHVLTANERIIAEDMLASLFLRRHADPANLAQVVNAMEAELDVRIAPATTRDLLDESGLSAGDLSRILYTRARAELYADENVAPVTQGSDEDAREAFRNMAHPYKSAIYDAKKLEFQTWLAHERMRRVELEYFETARTRVKVVWASGGPSS